MGEVTIGRLTIRQPYPFVVRSRAESFLRYAVRAGKRSLGFLDRSAEYADEPNGAKTA